MDCLGALYKRLMLSVQGINKIHFRDGSIGCGPALSPELEPVKVS